MGEVTIVGGGPVGLLLALSLHGYGVRATVLERRSAGGRGSRSIGIHPPALELLDSLGLGERFLARGVRVRRGLAFAGKRPIGSVDFGSCAGPHRYVLTLEQEETERILAQALEEREPGALQSGIEVLDVRRGASKVHLRVRDQRQREHVIESAFVVGCDGRRSRCREALHVSFRGGSYPGGYLMADAEDTTELGDDAAVFVSKEGLVESFPLPNHTRRWVVRRAREGAVSSDELSEVIEARTGHRVRGVRGLSAFHAEHFIADRLAIGRVALAGDAAHVVSPIGGQGMNLGWLGARSLARALARASKEAARLGEIDADARRRKRMARAAARRAELNMWLGRPTAHLFRDPMLRTLLTPPLADGLARLFTMRGLAWGV